MGSNWLLAVTRTPRAGRQRRLLAQSLRKACAKLRNSRGTVDDAARTSYHECSSLGLSPPPNCGAVHFLEWDSRWKAHQDKRQLPDCPGWHEQPAQARRSAGVRARHCRAPFHIGRAPSPPSWEGGWGGGFNPPSYAWSTVMVQGH